MSDETEKTLELSKDIASLVSDYCQERGVSPVDCSAAMIDAAAAMAAATESTEASAAYFFKTSFLFAQARIEYENLSVADDVDALLKRAGASNAS